MYLYSMYDYRTLSLEVGGCLGGHNSMYASSFTRSWYLYSMYELHTVPKWADPYVGHNVYAQGIVGRLHLPPHPPCTYELWRLLGVWVLHDNGYDGGMTCISLQKCAVCMNTQPRLRMKCAV